MSGRLLPPFRLDRVTDGAGRPTRQFLYVLDAIRDALGGDAATTGESALTAASATPLLSIGAVFGREAVAPFLMAPSDDVAAPVSFGVDTWACEPVLVAPDTHQVEPLPMPVAVEDTASGGFLFL